MTETTATTPTTRGQVRTERSAKRVRAYLGGEVVADTIHPVLVWEVPYYPAYYFPVDDVRADALEPDGGVQHSPSRGDARTFTVTAGGKSAPGAAWRDEVQVDGVTIADSTHARMLFETGLPVRYYVPKPDVRLDLLTPTETVTHCPYKGAARYWSVRAGDRVHDD